MTWPPIEAESYEGPYRATPAPEVITHILDDDAYREVRDPERNNGTHIVVDEGGIDKVEAVQDALTEGIGNRYATDLEVQRIGTGPDTEIYEVVWL